MATIYFSGAISGGREDLAIYRLLVEHLRERGHRVVAGEVINDQIGREGEALGPDEIFHRDLQWIEEVSAAGGVLVAEVSRPSIGVGYEIATSRWKYGMPVICLYRKEHTRRCSAMVAGDPGIILIEYSDDSIEAMTARLLAALEEVTATGRNA